VPDLARDAAEETRAFLPVRQKFLMY